MIQPANSKTPTCARPTTHLPPQENTIPLLVDRSEIGPRAVRGFSTLPVVTYSPEAVAPSRSTIPILVDRREVENPQPPVPQLPGSILLMVDVPPTPGCIPGSLVVLECPPAVTDPTDRESPPG